ncbi:uncharacterized protein PV06_02668 [Exophiala oligosperma]|uniref:Uncharacterized protein n=1 Tax=Exophiala oligosperma TaxID=215243 RepID=A0A0D2DVC1_9EURO|nr:uncharacterized protein PV06_02668 [Exophiala oligosperma]KIW47058.1 hypothetical protein PV06_02668 [Exophiala oligosperma]
MSTTPTIHVLGVFTESSPFSSLQDKSNATRAEQRLHGRIVLKKQTRDSTSFDHVDVQVHGAIRNTIGSKVVVERFSSSTETLSALDLKPAYSATGQDTQAQEREQEQHLDFSCLVPTMPINGRKTVHEKGRGEEGESVASTTTDDKTNDGFIPSMSISGSTYVTRVTAIRDRHLVQGRCEVLYWLEAVFLKSTSTNSRNNHTTHVVRRLTCPVDISSPCTPLEVCAGDDSGTSTATTITKQIAKPQTWATTFRCLSSPHHHHHRRRHHPQPAEISISLPRKLGCIVCDSSRLATGCRRLTIPISVNVKKPLSQPHPQTRNVAADNVAPTESLQCSINSKWYTRRSFNTGSSAVGSLVTSTTVSTHKTTLVTPPLYCDNPSLPFPEHNNNSTYPTTTTTTTTTTTMDLNLLLPESSTTTPSVSSDLLNISYNLVIEMQFTLVDRDGVKTCYNTDLHLPVQLRTVHPPQDVLRTQYSGSFDPLLGYVEEDHVRYAPPPYIC